LKTDARKLAIEAAKIAADTRCVNVVVLGTGTSTRQMRTVANAVEEYGTGEGQEPINRSVDDHWILLDYVDVVLHVFSEDARHFYDLESLWGEAKPVEWKKS
jgi:ribosome-associated protein